MTRPVRSLRTALGLVALLSLPALAIGWLHDDYWARAMLAGPDHPAAFARRVDELYCFSGGPRGLEPSAWTPWWANRGLTTCFFRPLASLDLAADHLLLGTSPLAAVIAHAEGLLWLLLTTAGVGRLAARLFGPAAGPTAALIYGLGSFNASAIGWVAARHALLSGAATVWALDAWVSERRGRACAGLLLALACGEGGLSGIAFAGAWEVCASQAPVRDRLLRAAALLTAALMWVAAYAWLGYGAIGMGGYLDPLRAPGAFLRELPGRTLALIGEAVFGVPSALWSLSDHRGPLLAEGALGAAVLAAAWRGDDAREARVLRALAIGAALATAPGVASVIGGRVLTGPAIGLAIGAAALLGRAERPWPVRALAAGLLVLNPAAHVAQLLTLAAVSRAEAAFGSAPAACPSGPLVVLGSAELSLSMYGPYLLDLGRTPWLQLTAATGDQVVERLDSGELRLTCPGCDLLGGLAYTLYRPTHAPLRVGDVRAAAGAVLTIEEADEDSVGALRVSLPEGACVRRYDGHGLALFDLPPTGPATVPYAPGPMSF